MSAWQSQSYCTVCHGGVAEETKATLSTCPHCGVAAPRGKRFFKMLPSERKLPNGNTSQWKYQYVVGSQRSTDAPWYSDCSPTTPMPPREVGNLLNRLRHNAQKKKEKEENSQETHKQVETNEP